MKKSKAQWRPGDVFGLPLQNGWYCMGQVLGTMDGFKNVVNCAFFDIRFECKEQPPSLDLEKLIAVISTTRELLDDAHWPIVKQAQVCISKSKWPNEHLAKNGYIGATTYGAGIVSNFILAYFGLHPWNCYKDPEFFDKLLISPSKKPPSSTLVLKEKQTS